MGATEIVQALVSPAEKLIDAVTGAIGKAYEPRHMRKMADAEAYRIKTLAEATAEAAMVVPTIFEKDGLSLDASNFEDLAKRTSSRLALQEMRKQQNIEAVVDYAYQELKDAEAVPDTPVDEDWMFRFFDSVENVSDEDVQKIWGRILAGEIKCPNSYSYRTLECLKKMTKKEIEAFQEVASTAFQTNEGNYFILKDQVPESCVIKIMDSNLRLFQECGLISTTIYNLITAAHPCIINHEFFATKAFNRHIAIVFKYGSVILNESEVKSIKCIEIPIYLFTLSGIQLLNVIHHDHDIDVYIQDILQNLKLIQLKNSRYNRLCITAHQIRNFTEDGEPEYDDEDILATYKLPV